MAEGFNVSSDSIWRALIGTIFFLSSAAAGYSIRLDAKLAELEEQIDDLKLSLASYDGDHCSDSKCDTLTNSLTRVQESLTSLPKKGEIPQWVVNDLADLKSRVTANERTIWAGKKSQLK